MHDRDNSGASIDQLLARFGLDEAERVVYLSLAKRGWSTVLELSRVVAIKRATLYRVLERLVEKGLVETAVDDKSTQYSAAPVSGFETLVVAAQQKVDSLRGDFDLLKTQLAWMSKVAGKETKVRFFRGKRGLQQMEWRKVEQPGVEILMFGSGQWHGVLGEGFAETIRAQKVEMNIRVREVLNPGVFSKTQIEEMRRGIFSWTHNQVYGREHFDFRVVPLEVLSIGQDIHVVGEDILHFHGFREDDLMGIEIVSREFAAMVRQLFELVWRVGE